MTRAAAHEHLPPIVHIEPIGLTEREALAYTRVGEKQMREWRRNRIVRFIPRGPGGALITQRTQLDAALSQLFDADNSKDFDFGED
jgi:hypothetical protein